MEEHTMLNQITAIVENGIKVEVKDQNRYSQYPVIAQDVTEGSITKEWSLTYYPKLYTKGNTRLYDGKETFTTLSISNFSRLYSTIMAVDQRFAQGENVEVMNNNRRRATYEFGNKARFTATQQEKYLDITLTITDTTSPFHMLSIYFRVINSKENGARHLIGQDERWDRNSDVFSEGNARLSPKKKRYLQVFQEDQNTVPYVRALSRPGMNNNTQVDPNNAEYLYIQDISSEYKALAFIYEQNILRTVMTKGVEQVIAKQQQESQQMSAGFGTQADIGFGAQGGFNQPSNGFGGFVNPQQEQQQFQQQIESQLPTSNQQQPVGIGTGFMSKIDFSDDNLPF
jgi:hypothetical protein